MGNQIKPIAVSEDEYKARLKEGLSNVDVYEQLKTEISKITELSGDEHIVTPAYFHYPYENLVVRTIDRESYFLVRTNRNRLLIAEEEQAELRDKCVGVAGMSVGAGIAVGLAYSGISQSIKIADNDTLDGSNLNRLRESMFNIGREKTELAASNIYNLDPYADVRIYQDGVTLKNIADFFDNPKLDLVVDEIDDFKMKVKLRHMAKDRKVPLIMLTSLGDNILIDVERYDVDESARPFNGLLHDDGQGILDAEIIDDGAIRKYSVDLVGPEYIPTKALKSVALLGRSLVGRPQLYSTIAVDGGLATYLIRKILTGADIASGRYFVKFGDFIGLTDDDFQDDSGRQEILNLFSKK